MAKVNVYLTFNGNCGPAFDFYKSVLGGEFATRMTFKDAPGSGDGDGIMHVALPVSSETILMGSDTNEQHGRAVIGDNFSISISADSKEEADNIYNGLSAGGKATMPMDNTFWGSYFGMLTDKFDINWMVSYDAPQNK